MPRPRRTTANAFYDVFADFPVDEQAAALRILEQVHRLKVRESKPKEVQPSPDARLLATNTRLLKDGQPVESLGDVRNPANNAALLLDQDDTEKPQ